MLRSVLLDGLDAVPWHTLHHAYGEASDVPDLLRGLADPAAAPPGIHERANKVKSDVREQIRFALWGNVFHQGTRWQVTAHVVPFLVELLCDGPDDAELRRFLVTYLHHLALGYPTDRFPRRPDPDHDFAAAVDWIDPGGEPTYDDDERAPTAWARDSYLAVERAVPAILRFARAPDEATATATIALLSAFPRRAELVIPVLLELAATGRGERAGAAVLTCALLIGADAQAAAERLVGSDDRLIAIHAACASVIASAATASLAAVEVLTTPLEALAAHGSPFADNLSTLVARCLPRVPPEHLAPAVEALCRQHHGENDFTRVSLTAALLSLVFRGARAPAVAAELTALQRHALETVRDHGGFGRDGVTFVNYVDVLRRWGVPTERKLLARYLAGE